MRARLAAALLFLLPGPVSAHTGSAQDPIPVRMKHGADTITLTGHLRQNRNCCAYRFKALAGQRLIWRVKGPAIRVTMTYPDGSIDGPGLPGTIALPGGGIYVFTVRPNLMADNAFGHFVLTLKIPPVRH